MDICLFCHYSDKVFSKTYTILATEKPTKIMNPASFEMLNWNWYKIAGVQRQYCPRYCRVLHSVLAVHLVKAFLRKELPKRHEHDLELHNVLTLTYQCSRHILPTAQAPEVQM